MTELLAIETAFLARTEVKAALQIKTIKTLLGQITNGQKKKFEQSLLLSKAVSDAVEWYRSEAGQASLNEAGITWTTEQFGNKVFGWQRSFFYKMVKVGGIEAEKVEAFKLACDQLEAAGKDANRSIEGLIKYANTAAATTTTDSEGGDEDSEGGEGEADSEAAASVERATAVFTMTYKREEGNVSIRVMSDGSVKTTNDKEDIRAALHFLTAALANN